MSALTIILLLILAITIMLLVSLKIVGMISKEEDDQDYDDNHHITWKKE